MKHRHAVRFLLTGALIAAAGVALTPRSANAAQVVVVTTTADVVAADGMTSLREAFDAANTDGDDTVIQLAAGSTYQLTDCLAKEPVEVGMGFFVPPPDDDLNLDGDLDHTAADDLTIEGNGATIENTCLYDRVLHSHEQDALVTLDDVTIAGGVSPPDFGTNIWFIGAAAMTDVTVTDGAADLGGQSASVVLGFDTMDDLGLLLTMSGSTILGNVPGGVRVLHGDAIVTDSMFADNDGPGLNVTFGSLSVDSSTFVDNNGNGISGIDSSITVTDSAAGNNTGWGVSGTGNTDSGQDLDLDDVNLIDNSSGGASCSYCTNTTLTNSTVYSNDGPGIAMRANLVGPTMTITNSTIQDNVGVTNASTEAGGIDMHVEDGPTPVVTIVRSTIAGNTSGPGGAGGGIRLVDAGLTISHSTISGNEALGQGGGIASVGSQPIDLDFVTLVENTTGPGGGANVQRDNGLLDTTATVIGMPIGGPNCVAAGGSMTSGGATHVTDTSCMLASAADDLIPSPNPLLAPLGDNGGPTPTRIPQAGSTMLGAVTGSLCTNADLDQRGISRPQGAACEVGAVEENETLAAVMLVGREPLSRADRILRHRLELRGFDVVTVDDDDLGPTVVSDIDQSALLFISASVKSWKVTPYAGELAALDVPLLNSEGYLSDDLGLAHQSGETRQRTKRVHVADGASSLEGRIKVLFRPRRMAFGTTGAGAEVIATASGVHGHPPVVFAYPNGAALADGSAAPAARGAFFFDDRAPLSARPAAFVLLDELLDRLS